MTQVICTRVFAESPVVFDYDGDAFSNPQANITRPVEGTDGYVHFCLGANDQFAVVQMQSSNALHAGLWADGAEIEWGSGLALTTDAADIAMHPTDPTLFMTLDSANFSKWAVYRINENDLSISKLASIDETISLAYLSGNMYSWNEEGNRFAAGNRNSLYLYGWDGSALTQLSSLAIRSGSGNRIQAHFVPGTQFIFCGNGTDEDLDMVSWAGDTLTQVDSYTFESTSFCRSGVSPSGLYAYQGGRPGVASASIILPINGDGTFGSPINFPDPTNDAHFISDQRIVSIYDDGGGAGSEVVSWSFDGSTLTELSRDSDNVPNSQQVHISATSPTPPPTVQQQFNVTYADVAGRDPLPTALSQRAATRNLVNYLVSNFAGVNRRRVTSERVIPQGQLHLVRPAPAAGDRARMIWIEDPRSPDFHMGRWAVIVGASAGSSPDKVVLELEIANNPESFVRPT